ncbi:MAG: cadherin repeat domain-containing protein [Cyclobacteriaceae bacterium]
MTKIIVKYTMKIASFGIIVLTAFLFACDENGESSEQTCEITAESPIFAIREHEPDETIVGQIEATADNNSTITYSIVSGNQFNTFALDPSTGTLTVNNSEDLDFEKIEQFILEVRASSESCRPVMIQATVNVVDIDDSING